MVYPLDKIDRRILFELDKNARIADTQLGRKIGRSKESIRYRIKKLTEDGVINRFTIWIDPTKLGYQTAKVYLTLANIPDKKRKFVEYVKKDKRLLWLGIGEGAWNAGLTYFVRSNKEFFELKNDLVNKFKELILEVKTGSLVGVYFHERTFFYEGTAEWKGMFEQQENLGLDNISIKILKELFKYSRENVATIAEKYNTTVDIVRNRIRKLEQQRIIAKYTIAIDYKKIGYEFYKTFLYFKSINDGEMKSLMDHCLKNPFTIHLVKQISPWDVELEIMCKSYEDYNQIIDELTEKFSQSIYKIETAIMGEDYLFPADKMVFDN